MATLDEILEHIIATDLKEKPLQDGDIVCYTLNNSVILLGLNGNMVAVQVVLEPPVPVDMELDEDSMPFTQKTFDRLTAAIKRPPERTNRPDGGEPQ